VTSSLLSRGLPLAEPAVQHDTLARLPLACEFGEAIARAGQGPLKSGPIEVLQINVGKLCNQTCRHCHVDAGDSNAQRAGAPKLTDRASRSQDRLRRHAACVQAVTPEPIALDQCHPRAKSGRADGVDEAGCAAPDHDEVVRALRRRVPPARRAHETIQGVIWRHRRPSACADSPESDAGFRLPALPGSGTQNGDPTAGGPPRAVQGLQALEFSLPK